MKKLLHYLTILTLLLLSGIAFTACGSDDDEPTLDPASIIAGEYVGNGSLDMLGFSVEKYQGMKIRVSKSSNEYVIVSPYLADGSPVFGDKNGTVFQVTQTASGNYVLNSQEAPLTQLTISKAGHMDFEYPYVSVGGESGYTLKFSGNKE